MVRFWNHSCVEEPVPSLRQILHVLEGAGEHYFEPVGVRSDMGVSLSVSSSELADRCVDADVLILEQVEEVVVVAWSETLLVGDAVELRRENGLKRVSQNRNRCVDALVSTQDRPQRCRRLDAVEVALLDVGVDDAFLPFW